MITELIVTTADDHPDQGYLQAGQNFFPCALGKAGITGVKTEGDLKTPTGVFPLRQIFYRYDRLATPLYSPLPLLALLPEDGWCNDPADTAYNQPVLLPYSARAERLWRDDPCYDVIVVLGYNDGPVKKERGSAIFLHVARETADGLVGTEGCVALKKADLLNLLPQLGPQTCLRVTAAKQGGANADTGGSTGNGGFKIAAHSHG